MPIRISFQLHWLLACLCLITITGCFYKAEPDIGHLRFNENTLPDITLTRRVVPEVGYEQREIYGKLDTVRVESKSRFGNPNEEPDLSCIYTGLREALPSIEILPTSDFWEQIDASQNTVELTELFATPQSKRLRALQADVLVVAYHARIDLRYKMMEGVFEGVYDDTDRETATIVVVDLNRKTIIHGSSISFEDNDAFAHVFWIVPMIMSSREPFDICNKVAHQAGTAIAETMPDRPIRALVVMAAKAPIAAATVDGALEAEKVKKAEKFAQERGRLELEANKGSTDAQLKLFKGIRASNPTEALRWLCYSADLGNQEARKVLAEIYEHGGYIWIKEGIIERNYKLAYVWRGLSGQYYPGQQQSNFSGQYLTPAELSEAKKMLEDWQPGNCERELGLTNNN